MCQRISCSQCGKPTFKGCGKHVEQVLKNVAVADRCHCADEAPELDAKFFKEARLTPPGGDLVSQDLPNEVFLTGIKLM